MIAPARISDAQSAFNTGRELLQSRDAPAALTCFNHARAMGFDPDQCAAQSWFCHMLLGQFERAWQQSDDIASRGAPDPHAWWDGKPIRGGTVMVRCLHGLGDTLQFIRYATELRERVSRIIVSAPATLISLLRTMPAIDEVCGWDGPGSEPAFDQQLEVTEFPRIFRTLVNTIPARVPYFHLPPVDRPHRDRIRVGLCWQASNWDTSRWIPFHDLAPLRATSGVEFATLQFGSECIGERLADPTQPVLKTALAIQTLDLVITVDTMIAHLAGALGKPVWIMLPCAADWRWMLNQDKSPWYPSARLFRQTHRGDWSCVLNRVRAALAAYASRSTRVPEHRTALTGSLAG